MTEDSSGGRLGGRIMDPIRGTGVPADKSELICVNLKG
jgi:hypothetical protein